MTESNELNGVPRRLFQNDDEDPNPQAVEENSQNFVTEELRKDYDKTCLKYNFDFENEKPLPGGDWDWEKMIEDEPDGDVEVKEVAEANPELNNSVNTAETADKTADSVAVELETV